MNTGLVASVHARLLARARERGEDFNLILTRYAVERFLYRLSISPARGSYYVKGALLFDLWFGLPHRPTRDMDFLCFSPADATTLLATVYEVCGMVADDGMEFDPVSIHIEQIREDARYGGLRVRLLGRLGNARCPIQLDIGYGDVVTPGPEEIDYPTLLNDQPAPRLLAYPRATVAAEKLEAIVRLGMTNNRMKDYFDLRALAREGRLEAGLLADAIAATFSCRQTALPASLPLGLSDEFAQDATNRMQWKAFLGKNRIDAPALDGVVEEVREWVTEPMRLARERATRS